MMTTITAPVVRRMPVCSLVCASGVITVERFRATRAYEKREKTNDHGEQDGDPSPMRH
jgi:hypothetical protein